MSLLKLRADRKAKKPRFVRQNAGHKKEVGTKYRKPKGYQSKLRLYRKGLMPSQGYRAPASVRGLNPQGLTNVLVYTSKDVESIHAKTQCAVIGSSVGRRRKIELLEKIIALKVPVSIDAVGTLEILKNQFAHQKESRKAVEEKRHSKAKSDSKDAKKDSKDNSKSDVKDDKESSNKDNSQKDLDSSKKDEKKEQEKILTKKETAM